MTNENKMISLEALTQQILSSRMPMAEETDAALIELGVQPTVGATLIYSIIQKACKGDTSAAKFIKELNGEGESDADLLTGVMTAYSETMLRRLAGQLPAEEEPQPVAKPKRTRKGKKAEANE